MIIPAQRQRTRGDGPMARIRAIADRLMGEAGVRDLAHFCVQPWIDAPGLGFTAVATGAGDEGAALRAAEEVARAMWDSRSDFLVETTSPDEAIARGLATPGFVVLADASDCVGGGASGDSAALLAALLRHAPGATASIHVADDVAAAAARAAGPGARIRLGLGNRRDPAYGPPLEVEAEVLRATDGTFTYSGGLMGGVRAEGGPSAVLRVGAIEVLATSNACYEYADEAFAAAGIDVRSKKFLVVKNPMNYQQAFADAALRVVVDTPGPTTPNLAALPWRDVGRPLFPVDLDAPPRLAFWTRGREWTSEP
jgi:microcystin degradation protein MlrC